VIFSLSHTKPDRLEIVASGERATHNLLPLLHCPLRWTDTFLLLENSNGDMTLIAASSCLSFGHGYTPLIGSINSCRNQRFILVVMTRWSPLMINIRPQNVRQQLPRSTKLCGCSQCRSLRTDAQITLTDNLKIMRHDERSSPNAPESSLSFSVASPQRLEAPRPFSHNSAQRASRLRKPTRRRT